MLVSLLAALAAAIIVLTWLYTLEQYRTLPEQVPLHIGPTGVVDTWGPRFTIWLLPAVQLIVAGVMLLAAHAIATDAPGTHGTVRGLAFFSPCILAIVLRAQALLISAAKLRGSRVPMTGFWLFFAAMFAVAMLSAFLL